MKEKTNTKAALEALRELEKSIFKQANYLINDIKNWCERSRDCLLKGKSYDETFEEINEVNFLCLGSLALFRNSRKKFSEQMKKAGYEVYEPDNE